VVTSGGAFDAHEAAARSAAGDRASSDSRESSAEGTGS